MRKLVVLGVSAVAASTIGLLNAGLASSDPASPNQANVIGEPYYKAVKILQGMGFKTTFGGSVGSDLPQAQCMVASQKMISDEKMQMNLDCTKKAAQLRRRHQYDQAATEPDRLCRGTRGSCACPGGLTTRPRRGLAGSPASQSWSFRPDAPRPSRR